jgi:hypothetical protein
MAVNPRKVKSAIKALQGLDVGGINRLLANAHLFDKHISRNASQNGSWFEKTSHTVTDTFQLHGLSDKRKEQFASKFGLELSAISTELAAAKPGTKSFTIDGVTQDLTVKDVPDLLGKILKQPIKALHDSPTQGRFTMIVEMPDGYVGRNINQQGKKEKLDGALVKLVINTDGNAQIVTLFPVAKWYKDKNAAIKLP